MQTQACDRCHRRKTRCDRRIPRCSACERANVSCLHTDKLNSLSYPRAYIDSLEATIRRVQSEKEQLELQVAALRESLASQSSPRERNPSPRSETAPPAGQGTETAVPEARQNVITSEVGFLTLKAIGEQRYLGSGSGVTLAGIVHSLVGSARLVQEREPPCPETSVQGDSTPIRPPRSTAATVIEAYFNHWHLAFPLICRARFLHLVDRIYADEQYLGANPFDAFLFHMVLGMGSVNFNRPNWSATSSEGHYVHAVAKLEEVLSMKGLAPLQAMLLICQYSIFCSLRDTSANMWHLIGIAARWCVEMGLHRKNRMDDAAAHGIEAGQVQLDVEARKRTFWCFYNLDRIISVTLGRPVAVRDEDIDIPLPTAFDIDDLSLDELERGRRTARLQHKSPFLHLIGIRKIAGKILQLIHCASKADGKPMEEKLALRRELQDELEAWKSDIANVKMPAGEHGTSPRSPFQSRMWYEVPYHNALLLLYRPSPMFPPVPSLSSSNGPSLTGLNQILISSVSAIHLYAELHRTRRLNYSWITLHAVFIAGLSYVYSISRVIKESTARQDPLPICLEYTRVIDVTRACSNVLVAINERWGAARGSCEIFERLSTAIIQDSVKAQLESTRRAPIPSPAVSGGVLSTPRPQPSQREQDQLMEEPTQNSDDPSSSALNDTTFAPFSETYPIPTAETGFRQFSQNVHNQISHEFPDLATIPSEVAMGFSQTWFADDLAMNEFQAGNVYSDISMEPFG
ncbi:fungal-specific transcription factor domain-containing protein [Aspergillus unguis]